MSINSEWTVSSANRTLKIGLIELFKSRPILYALVKRELKSRYRGSLFGFAWALGKPISMLLVFYFVVGEILGASRSIEYFALYIFVGLMFWNLFSESAISGTNSIVQNSGLIQKIAFPREILPIATVVIASVNTLIQFPVLLLGYLMFGVWPSFAQVIWAVPMIIILLTLTLALTLTLSALNVYVRDIQPLTELSVMLLMYATPIIYSWTFVFDKIKNTFDSTFLFDVYMLNPLAVVITGLQDALWPGVRLTQDGSVAESLSFLSTSSVAALIVISFLALAGSYKLFLKLEPNFAREL